MWDFDKIGPPSLLLDNVQAANAPLPGLMHFHPVRDQVRPRLPLPIDVVALLAVEGHEMGAHHAPALLTGRPFRSRMGLSHDGFGARGAPQVLG